MRMHNTYREKLLNAILYFCKHTQKTSKLKIFKLLFFLDFTHFKETGRSVTNLDYYAFGHGPIPLEFFKEIKEAGGAPQDFKASLNVVGFESEFSNKKGEICSAKKSPNMDVFSPREKRIMQELSYIFKDADAEVMTEASHLENKPWDLTRKTKGDRALIDYLLALDGEAKISKDDAIEALQGRKEMLEAFPPLPRLANER